MDVNPMVSKSKIGHFQLGKGPSRGLLRDCENIVEPMDRFTALMLVFN